MISDQIITKDKLSDQSSPFQLTGEDWYYDAATNCSYYKSVIPASTDAHNFSFDINSTYFYSADTTHAYREAIKVQVSYSVEIVQANRAETIWGIDPSTL